MAGLVLGIHVAPPRAPPGSPAVAAEPVEPRRLRLLVQQARAPADSAHLMGYALQEGGVEPAGDSAPIPGSTLVLERGRPVRITVVNRLAEPTAVHWHGIELESYPDGVPGWSGTDSGGGADGAGGGAGGAGGGAGGAGGSGRGAETGRRLRAIAPGDSFTAEFTPPRAGTFIYHSHANELVQIQGGLYGPLIVVEPGTTYDTASNRLVVVGGLFHNDSAFGLVNGRLAPAPIEIRAGRSYRFRLINIGDARAWLGLRRLPPDSSLVTWRAVAKDGADLPPSQAVAAGRLLTGPGETADFAVRVEEPGELRLEVDSPFAGWRVEVPVRVR